jgi:hypothetical protein
MWYIRHAVTARAARFAYGTKVSVKYDPDNPNHHGIRLSKCPKRGDIVNGVWDVTVAKVISPMLRVSGTF